MGYCSKAEKMTEEDFCRHMLYTSSLTSKKKEKMLARVSKRFKGQGPGISFTSFKNFYNVLFGGADLERAMFYLDTEGRGVNREIYQDRKLGLQSRTGPSCGGCHLHTSRRGRRRES